MRVLAIDPGDRWVGVAICDDDGRVALPLATLDRRDEPDGGAATIRGLLGPEGAGLVLLGVPVDPDGVENAQAARFRRYGERLAEALALPAIAVDERYSNPITLPPETHAPRSRRRRLRPAEHRRRRRVHHATAAAAILQRWLDADRPTLTPAADAVVEPPQGQR